MQKMKVLQITNSSGIILSSGGKNPAVCIVSNLRFHDTEPVLQMGVDWVSRGSYTNGKRKKLLARTMTHFLKRIVRIAKHT